MKIFTGNSLVWLEEIRNGWWQLRLVNTKLHYYFRMIFEDDNSIIAVDLPGGPFISVGYKFQEGYEVLEIKKTTLGIFLKLKEPEILICDEK